MIDVIRVTRVLGRQKAVEDLSFTLPENGVVGLVGHNGSGKSTTMRLITGCLTPTAGQVLVDKKSVSDSPEARRKIGYLPEIPPLYMDMTVSEQMTFAARIRGIRDSSSAIEKALRLLNVYDVRGRLIGNLSKGYRQRVGFAQAILGSPPYLVLDEPMVGLDPAQILEVRQAIAELSRDHLILISSHILSEIATSCHRLLVLSNGRLVADDTLENLLAANTSSDSWKLVVDGDADVLIPTLKALPGIRSVAREESAPGQAAFRLTANSDFHEALFALLSEKQCPIRLLQPAHLSLEELFLKLTADRRYKEAV